MNSSKPIIGTVSPREPVLPTSELGMQLGLLAYPADHSLSPQLHKRALTLLSHHYPPLRNWEYKAYAVTPADFPATLLEFHAKGFWGLNISNPHKQTVMSLLCGCDAETRRMGASNTLLWTPEGYWGTNTDGVGLEKALRTSFGFGFEGCSILVIGAGGAARAAAFTALKKGCRHLWLFNRNACNAIGLQEALLYHYPDALVDLWTCQDYVPIDCIIYAATAPPYAPPPLELSLLKSRPCVYDMRYGGPTSLLLEARRLRLPCADGAAMLRAQGLASLRYWLHAVQKSPAV